VEYLLSNTKEVNPIDRWGNTPLDEAIRGGHEEAKTLLRNKGGLSAN